MARCFSKSPRGLVAMLGTPLTTLHPHSKSILDSCRGYGTHALITKSLNRSLSQRRLTIIPIKFQKKIPFSSSARQNQQSGDGLHSEARTSDGEKLSKNVEPKKDNSNQRLKRRVKRTSAATTSLRRVAVEAQRSRDGKDAAPINSTERDSFKTVAAICAAQEYNLTQVVQILENYGLQIDPYETDLYPQVVHVVYPFRIASAEDGDSRTGAGDLFIFPSGTVVGWGIPEKTLSQLVYKGLRPAASFPLIKFEEEDLEYAEDASRENSTVTGDRILLGTKPRHTSPQAPDSDTKVHPESQNRDLDSVLTKIAFSSGLARSTKLAVLESLLADYFESTRSIPDVLSRGSHMPFTRKFISQKTGQLLSIRAQLNLYSELTDSLPDLFWDSRHELGLEGYFDQVSKALDTNIRIKILNEKMDYAQEIASVLRQQLSERHGVRLEWIIILLIAVEVVFAIDKEVKEYRERNANDTMA